MLTKEYIKNKKEFNLNLSKKKNVFLYIIIRFIIQQNLSHLTFLTAKMKVTGISKI